MINKIAKYSAALAFCVFTACSQQSVHPKPVAPEHLTGALDATHAVDLEIKTNQLTFVPNETAPWLGRIIGFGAHKDAISMDIENRNNTKLKLAKPRSALGLSFKNNPGVFLLVDQNGALHTYIESDDKGNFVEIISSAAPNDIRRFCLTDTSNAARVFVLEKNYAIQGYDVSLNANPEDKPASQLTFKKSAEATFADVPQSAQDCAVWSGDAYIRAAGKKQDVLYVQKINSSHWQSTPLPYKFSGLAPIKLNDALSFVGSYNGYFAIIPADAPSKPRFYTISDGLSIQGMDKVGRVFASNFKYGGAAFNQGVIALIAPEKNRIVYLSASYVAQTFQYAGSN